MFLGQDSIRMLEYLNDITSLKSEISALRAQVETLQQVNKALREDLQIFVDLAVKEVEEQ